MKTVFIYALKDPDTGQIRYVGASCAPQKRLVNHLKDRDKNHRTNWIRGLRFANMKPVLGILDEVSETEWQPAEAAYIQFYRERGCDLVNGTDGGGGGSLPGEKSPMFGKKHSLEARAKISAGNMGKPSAMLGKKLSPETCAKISASKKGNQSTLGQTQSPQTILKRRATWSFNRLLRICQPIE